MTPLEAELTKYMHNVFGAYKVTYFNACREYCEQMGADWRKVHTDVLLSGYINDTHTYVPGPDGKFGYVPPLLSTRIQNGLLKLL